MRQTFTIAGGVASRGLSLPNGEPSYAVGVDNPSGYWVQVYPLAGYVAPYTMGTVLAFPVPAPQVDILPGLTGPSGQVGTSTGDAITVTLFDADEAGASVGSAAGDPFLAAFTRVLSGHVGNLTCKSGAALSTAILAPIVGKRYRLFSFTIDREDLQLNPFILTLRDTSPATIQQFFVGMGAPPPPPQLYPGGLDVDTGRGLNVLTSSAAGGDALAGVSFTYSII